MGQVNTPVGKGQIEWMNGSHPRSTNQRFPMGTGPLSSDSKADSRAQMRASTCRCQRAGGVYSGLVETRYGKGFFPGAHKQATFHRRRTPIMDSQHSTDAEEKPTAETDRSETLRDILDGSIDTKLRLIQHHAKDLLRNSSGYGGRGLRRGISVLTTRTGGCKALQCS